jgi:hypothetical protein
MRLGVEVSGVVSAVGADAHGPAGPIAYRVSGGYTDRLVVPGSAVVPKYANGHRLTFAVRLTSADNDLHGFRLKAFAD